MTSSRDEAAVPTRRYVVVAVVAGAAFGIIALLHVPGIWYAVIGIMLGVSYAVLAVTQRRPGAGRNRDQR